MNRFTNDPLNVGGAGGLGFGGGDGLGLIALLALLGGRRGGGLFGGDEGHGGGANVLAGDVAAKVVELQNSSNLRAEVRDTEAALRETILNQTIGLNSEFRGLEGRIDNAALDAVKAQYEAKIASLQATNVLERRIDDESEKIRTDIQQFQVSTDKQFCHVNSAIQSSTQTILNHLAADKLDAKNDEIAQLRAERNHLNQTLLFSNQLNSINSAINSIEQTQRLSNKVVQFGAGNTAIPVNTQNQA